MYTNISNPAPQARFFLNESCAAGKIFVMRRKQVVFFIKMHRRKKNCGWILMFSLSCL